MINQTLSPYFRRFRVLLQQINKFDIIKNKLKINLGKEIFFLLLALTVVITLNSCKSDPASIALRTYNASKGIVAVEKLTDQAVLEKVAIAGHNNQIRKAAIKKLTDQYFLAKIALADDNLDVRHAAVNNLTDQILLAKIIFDDRYLIVRNDALEKITDQFQLAKIFLEHKDSVISHIAFEKLNNPVLLTMINSFKTVPYDHRKRLMTSILPVIRFLNYPEVINKVGEIVSLNTEWDSISEKYWGPGIMPGERFHCSIKLKNLDDPLSYTWFTDFPTGVSVSMLDLTKKLEFKPARVSAGEILSPIFECLSKSFLGKIAVEDENQYIREFAVYKITDQSTLAKVVLEDEYPFIRVIAVNKITDQSTLAKVAVEDEYFEVRRIAVKKLIDQSRLTKIAIEDKDEYVREAAQQRLNELRKSVR